MNRPVLTPASLQEEVTLSPANDRAFYRLATP